MSTFSQFFYINKKKLDESVLAAKNLCGLPSNPTVIYTLNYQSGLPNEVATYEISYIGHTDEEMV